VTVRRLSGAAALIVAVAGCASAGPAPATPAATTRAPSAQPAAAGCPTAQPAPLARGEQRRVAVTTSAGSFDILVEADLGPIATGNFVALASCGYYDGVVFHRVVPGFVIQAGDRQYGSITSFDPQRVGTGGPGYTIADEPVVGQYTRGTVAMARSSRPNSQGSQFFICLEDLTGQLDPAGGYVILGHVTMNLDVVEAIGSQPNSGPPNNLPESPTVIQSMAVTTP